MASPRPESRPQFDAALAHHRAGRLDAALAGYDAAAAADPAHVDTHNNRAIVLAMLGRRDEAVAAFDRAIALNPRYAEAHVNRAIVLVQLNRLDAAVAGYERALTLAPGHLTAAVNKGLTLARLGWHTEAVAAYDAALMLRGDVAAIHTHRGGSLRMLEQLDAALAAFDRALALSPNDAEALFRRGETLVKTGRQDEARDAFDRAHAADPRRLDIVGQRLTLNKYLCRWDAVDADFALLAAAVRDGPNTPSPFTLLSLADDPALHLACAARHAAALPVISALPAGPRDGRIRVGYFSADFHAHATMYLFADTLAAHDRDRFEISLFSFGPLTGDAWQTRARASCDHFVNVRDMADEAIAARARAAGLDIAVDLKGYTGDGREGLFAHRAAPVQVSWLGYPGTMGAAFIDYVFADATVLPPGSPHWTEKIVTLPGSYQPNCALEALPPATSRAAEGLPGGIVFCCFNQAYKITRSTFALWLDILVRVEGSVLWLWIENAGARDRLRDAARARGLDADRLVFAGVKPRDAHLARLAVADLFLDTFPYGAHTTASDALRMGLPIVTRAGSSFASRVAASLLNAAGLPDLVTADDAAYVELAVALATDAARLSAIRARLAAHLPGSTLFDPVHFARKLEAAFTAVHDRARRGQPPGDTAV